MVIPYSDQSETTIVEEIEFRSLLEEETPAPQVEDPVVEIQNQDDSLEERLEQARAEAYAEARSNMEAALLAERQRIVQVLEEFEKERKRYFQDIEAEIVGLSLSIAEHILHREASMDPILLKGAVHAALKNLSEGSAVVIRVPVAEHHAWIQALEEQGDAVQVETDNSLESGQCILQTRTGRMDLGVRAQLKEIERGFFDLLAHKPAAA